MLMLENQLPMRVVLHTLIEVETDTAQVILKFLLHVQDINVRKIIYIN